MTTSISKNALIRRLRRRHARMGETFHINSKWHRFHDYGWWFVSAPGNYVKWRLVDVNDLIAHARRVGALAPSENLADSEVTS